LSNFDVIVTKLFLCLFHNEKLLKNIFCEDGVGWNLTWFTPSIFLKLPERTKDAKNKNK